MASPFLARILPSILTIRTATTLNVINIFGIGWYERDLNKQLQVQAEKIQKLREELGQGSGDTALPAATTKTKSESRKEGHIKVVNGTQVLDTRLVRSNALWPK